MILESLGTDSGVTSRDLVNWARAGCKRPVAIRRRHKPLAGARVSTNVGTLRLPYAVAKLKHTTRPIIKKKKLTVTPAPASTAVGEYMLLAAGQRAPGARDPALFGKLRRVRRERTSCN